MSKSSEMKEKQLQLQYEIEQLEKQRKTSMVEEGKAYYCKKCNTWVDKKEISPAPIVQGLCSNCFNRKWKEEKKQEILKKLKNARIVDIELASIYDIDCITVYKNGMLYDLKAEFDHDMDDEATIIIDHEYKDDRQAYLEMEEPEVKPWEKNRAEKKLC